MMVCGCGPAGRAGGREVSGRKLLGGTTPTEVLGTFIDLP